AYLVGTDTKSEPFKGEAETLESPHTVAPPTCLIEVSEGSGTSSARSTSSNFIAPLLTDHLLTYTTPILVPSLRRTARMVMRVSPAMSPGLSVGIAEVTAMSDSTFHKRFRSSYDSSPSPTFLVRKRYKGTSEIILDTDSEGDELGEEEDEEVEEILDSDSESKDVEDEGPTAEDEGPAAGDEGLTAGDEGPSMGVKSLGLGEDEVVPEGQQRAAQLWKQPFIPEFERPKRVSTSRQSTLTTWTDPEDGMVYIDVHAYPPLAPPVQTLPSHKWTSGSFLISPTPSFPSPLISLTIPSSVATHATAETVGFLTELGAQQAALQRELQEMRGRVTALEQERDRKEQ
nr:hypothetical protein [Tanacetum cinerariifolium]